jgi:urease alpha subunit
MVTLNPAKLLHIDDKVGSIKIGKDADLVLWSGNPLSIYTKAEKTIIEGTTYFDIKIDEQQRTNIKNERNILTQMMLKEKNKGIKTQPIIVKKKQDMHCDTLDHNEF